MPAANSLLSRSVALGMLLMWTLGIVLAAVGFLITVIVGQWGHYGGPNVPGAFWGRPGLLSAAGWLGPAMILAGIGLILIDLIG